jgi:hypothetical protein
VKKTSASPKKKNEIGGLTITVRNPEASRKDLVNAGVKCQISKQTLKFLGANERD